MAYPHSKFADQSADELTDMARVWADELKAVPFSRILSVYEATMENWISDFPPSVGAFRAAWQRTLIAAPRETFQEREAREEAARGFKAIMQGQHEMPAFVQLHHGLGRCVVCKCTFADGGNFDKARNRKFIDGMRCPARLREDGKRYECATYSCDFSIDAYDEAGLRANSVTPLTGGAAESIPAPSEVRVAPTITTTRAELFAEQCGLDWAGCSDEQRVDLGRMSKWLDWTKRGTLANAANFPQLWDEYLEKRAAEIAPKMEAKS